MKIRKATCLLQRKASQWGPVPLFQFPEGSTRSLLSWDCVTVTVPEQGCPAPRSQVLPLDEVLWGLVTGLTSVCVGVPRTVHRHSTRPRPLSARPPHPPVPGTWASWPRTMVPALTLSACSFCPTREIHKAHGLPTLEPWSFVPSTFNSRTLKQSTSKPSTLHLLLLQQLLDSTVIPRNNHSSLLEPLTHHSQHACSTTFSPSSLPWTSSQQASSSPSQINAANLIHLQQSSEC